MRPAWMGLQIRDTFVSAKLVTQGNVAKMVRPTELQRNINERFWKKYFIKTEHFINIEN